MSEINLFPTTYIKTNGNRKYKLKKTGNPTTSIPHIEIESNDSSTVNLNLGNVDYNSVAFVEGTDLGEVTLKWIRDSIQEKFITVNPSRNITCDERLKKYYSNEIEFLRDKNYNIELAIEPLVITMKSSGTMTLNNITNPSYKLNDASDWETYTDPVQLVEDDVIQIIAEGLPTVETSSNVARINISTEVGFDVSGSTHSLHIGERSDICPSHLFIGTNVIDASGLDLSEKPINNYFFTKMFKNCTKLTGVPALPATELVQGCYQEMFYGCSSLTTAPALPATTLAKDCYRSMFYNSGLTSLPVLPATTLGVGCYKAMFNGCTGITSIPANYLSATTTLAEECYYSMFSGCTGLTTLPTGLFPATTLTKGCYHGTFYKCSNLITVPTDLLPASTLADECYHSMFEECTKLTNIPTISATTVGSYSCYLMFRKCNALTSIPNNYILPALTLADSCYRGMFSYCDNLVTVPSGLLPATTLAINCYVQMFYYCDKLENTPDLPATTLATGCYKHMFSSTSITSLPALPATTLADECYYNMFMSCEGLTSVPKNYLPATSLNSGCYYSMFSGCKYITSAPDLPATVLKTDCYNHMFRDCIRLTTAPDLPATTLVTRCYQDMFRSCNSINYIKVYATNWNSNNALNWVSDVEETGTFYKPSSNNSIPSGVSGIPDGWTIVNF